jgi:hypothetical protein
MHRRLAAALAASLLAAAARAASDTCIACHGTLTPGIVSDWELSTHARRDVSCDTCHGERHRTAEDAANAVLPTPETCAPCHPERVAQFKRGKHARAWAAVRAIPNFHHGREGKPGDPSGCAACHRIGLRTAEETAALRAQGATHGMASCDACHTRHLFSRAEAREPDACRTCHGGGEHMQWDAWSQSKHGIRYDLQQEGILPAASAAPYCQLCHMPGGDHAVRTPWGSLGLRLPLPEDRAWAADRAVLFRALGVLDAAGGAGPRMRAVEEAGIAHLDRIAYQSERHRLTTVCRNCHAAPFVREQLDGRDRMLRDSDRLCADAVREVAALFEAGLLPAGVNGAFPDLVGSERSAIERRLASMFFEDRARLLATAFHMSPRHVEWRSALARDLEEIRRLAADLRRAGKRRTPR